MPCAWHGFCKSIRLMSMINPILGSGNNAVVQAIQSASSRTGVDFAYMLNQAKAESALDPAAKARTSSATGLYQFIESTWMSTVEKHGHKHGLGHLVADIDNPAKRQDILDLRNDPKIASLMAAELAADNRAVLEARTGSDIGATEMYFAHFLGAAGASNFINAMNENPYQDGATLFPAAANANKNVFYDRDTGRARTLTQIYDFFDKKFTDTSIPETQVAGVSAPNPARVSELFQSPHQYKSDGGFQAGYMQAISGLNNGTIPGSHFLMNPVEIMIQSQFDPLSALGEKDHITRI